MRQTVRVGNIRISLEYLSTAYRLRRCEDSHSSSDPSVQGLSFIFSHDSKQRVSIENSLGRVQVLMFNKLVFENSNLALVFKIEVFRHGSSDICSSGDIVVIALDHCVEWKALENAGTPVS
jgi:hypothetical protein